MIIRWQDWAAVALGGWLVTSPWALGFTLNHAAMVNACGLGAVLIVFNLISVLRLYEAGQELFNILMGLWLILSPYSLGFAEAKDPTLNVIAVGLIVIVLAVWQIRDSLLSNEKR